MASLHRNSRQSTENLGVSLLEILISVFIVAIAILPLLGLILDRFEDKFFIVSNRFAQEKGYDIMVRMIKEVPFEMLWESPSEGQPGSIRPQSSPGSRNGVVFDNTYAKQLLSSLFPDSSLICSANFTDVHGTGYSVILEVLDISDPSPTDFSGTTWNNPSTWNELYFDYYELPDFTLQNNWNETANQNNDGVISPGYITPCRYYGAVKGKLWGPPERALNGQTSFKTSFPRDQKDRTKPWEDWGGRYCAMKKLRLCISWNLDAVNRKNPNVVGKKHQEFWLVGFKANI